MCFTYSKSEAEETGKPIIDLSGIKGNAFFLLALADDIADQLGYSQNEKEDLRSKMTSDDYTNLVNTLNNEFDLYITILVNDYSNFIKNTKGQL